MPDSDLGPEEYLIYEVIRQNRQVGKELPKTEFHKQSFLAFKEIQESQGKDIAELPVYWHEHGMMVHLESLADIVDFSRTSYSTGPGLKTEVGDDITKRDFDDIPKTYREIIRETAREIAKRFKDTYDTSVAKDLSYAEYADNEFIKTLNEFRYELEDLSDIDQLSPEEYAPTDVTFAEITGIESSQAPDVSKEDRDRVLQYLDTMVVQYPSEKYQKMEPLFYEWESLTRQFAYNNMFSQLGNFTSEFWNTFSRVELRIKHSENIPMGTMTLWRQERPEHIEEFQETISEFRETLLEHREDTDELSYVAEEYSNAVEETYQDFREG